MQGRFLEMIYANNLQNLYARESPNSKGQDGERIYSLGK